MSNRNIFPGSPLVLFSYYASTNLCNSFSKDEHYAASVEKIIEGLHTMASGNTMNPHISSAMFLLKLSAAG